MRIQELDYYAEQYAKHGIGGTRKNPDQEEAVNVSDTRIVTWYRTREQNFKDETA